MRRVRLVERTPAAVETELRGRQLLADPRLTHGVAFTEEERHAFGLVGLLPPAVLSLDEQAARDDRGALVVCGNHDANGYRQLSAMDTPVAAGAGCGTTGGAANLLRGGDDRFSGPRLA